MDDLLTDNLTNALNDYVDARVSYASADPEWRSSPISEVAEVTRAIDALVADRVRAVLKDLLAD
jgi:hypothetical protein